MSFYHFQSKLVKGVGNGMWEKVCTASILFGIRVQIVSSLEILFIVIEKY